MQPKYLALVLLFASTAMWGQGACIPGQALTSRLGFSNLAAVVPQAQVQVSPGPIYTDQTDVTQTSNPITADNVGNYSICAAAGSTQTVTVTGANMNTLVYKLTFPATLIQGASTTGSNTFSGTNIFSGTDSFTGTLNLNGATNINAPISTYTSNALVAQGIPTEIATLDLLNQSATVSTVLCVAPITGWYRVIAHVRVTQAATTSSTLGTVGYQFTDGVSTVVTPGNFATVNSAGAVATTTTANSLSATGFLSGNISVFALSGSSVLVSVSYASVGATPMQYEAKFRCELL